MGVRVHSRKGRSPRGWVVGFRDFRLSLRQSRPFHKLFSYFICLICLIYVFNIRPSFNWSAFQSSVSLIHSVKQIFTPHRAWIWSRRRKIPQVLASHVINNGTCPRKNHCKTEASLGSCLAMQKKAEKNLKVTHRERSIR